MKCKPGGKVEEAKDMMMEKERGKDNNMEIKSLRILPLKAIRKVGTKGGIIIKGETSLMDDIRPMVEARVVVLIGWEKAKAKHKTPGNINSSHHGH